MKSGPQRYPGASTAYWYGSKYPGSAMESNVIVWHTTEGTSLPDYSGGSVAPNFTARPDFAAKRLVWYQHFDFDVSSRALVNAAGGVETNTLNVCQVEIVGTCDPGSHKKWGSTPHLYTPELPNWAIRDLAAFAKWAHDNHGVPLTSDVTFKAYPGSYGAGNGVRMSFSAWNGFKGHCGHQHVPENLHGDPGAFPMAVILNAAKGGTITSEEDPLAGMTKQDIFDAVWKLDQIGGPADAPDHDTNPTWQAQSILKDLQARTRALQASVTALSVTNAKLVDAVAKLAAEQADLDPAAIVAELKAAIESVTIHLDVPNA